MEKVAIQTYQDAAHHAQVVALWELVFGYDAPHNQPGLAIDKKLAVADGLLFVAVAARKVVGTVMAGYDGHRGWIYSLAVAPDLRRQGIGTRLVNAAEQELIHRGCVKINLQILAGNKNVTAFYESLGYAVEPRISMGKRIECNIPAPPG